MYRHDDLMNNDSKYVDQLVHIAYYKRSHENLSAITLLDISYGFGNGFITLRTLILAHHTFTQWTYVHSLIPFFFSLFFSMRGLNLKLERISSNRIQ